jgi:hypothetical protein
MIQLQPEIIVARVASHLQSMSSAGLVMPEVGFTFDVSGTAGSTNIVTRLYNAWAGSSSWLRYLLGQFEYHQNTKVYGTVAQEIMAKYKPPSWFSSWIEIHLHGYSTLDGWCFRLRTYRVIPYNCNFFSAVRSGNIKKVRSLLATKEAFVTDREESSTIYMCISSKEGAPTALHVSVYGEFLQNSPDYNME